VYDEGDAENFTEAALERRNEAPKTGSFAPEDQQ